MPPAPPITYLKDDQAAREIVQVADMKLWERGTTLRELQSPEDYLFIFVRKAVFEIATQLRVSKFTVKRHLEIARRYIRENIFRYFL